MQDFFFTVSLYIVYQCSSEEKKNYGELTTKNFFYSEYHCSREGQKEINQQEICAFNAKRKVA